MTLPGGVLAVDDCAAIALMKASTDGPTSARAPLQVHASCATRPADPRVR
jgi:hypothetical protein